MAHRTGIITVRLLLILLVLLAGHPISQVAAQEGDAFYDPPADLQDVDPGEIIRVEEHPLEFTNARVWRMLYVSTMSNGDHVAVSGLLAAPSQPAPADGYPLVTVGHGSVGVGRECAPSMDPYGGSLNGPGSYELFVAPLVDAGYVVVMSDYQGLGAPGASSYLVGDVEGRNLLDAARAAFSFPDLELQSELLIWGQSQGGHAALFAGYLSPSYAPELPVAGVVAEAPAADLRAMFTDLFEADARGGLVSLPLMTIQSWAQVYPGITIDALVTDRGQRILRNVIGTACLSDAFFSTLLDRPSDVIRPRALERLDAFVDANTPPFGPYAMPVLIVHGEADDVVPVETTERFVGGLCRAGSHVTYRTYAETGHIEVIDVADTDVLAWMQGVRQGIQPTSTCER